MQRKVGALADSAQATLVTVWKDLNDITGDSRQLLANLNDATGTANRRHLAAILTHSDTMIADLSPQINRITERVLKLTKDADIVVGKMGPTVDNADQTITAIREPTQADLAQLEKTIEEARGLISSLEVPVWANSQNTTYTMENLRMATDNLNDLTESVKERPWSLVRVKQPKDRKVPNKVKQMPAKKLALTTICTLMLLITGCVGKVRYSTYYTLALAPAMKPDVSTPHWRAAVAVRRFETPMYLRQGRIVYRETPDQIGFYEYHRWAADPGAAVTTAFIESLRSANTFSTVAPYDGQDRPEYLIAGRLERLDEIDYGDGIRVEAKLSAVLMNLRTGSIVWSGDATETSNVTRRDLNAVVAEMSLALQGSINGLLSNMEQQSGTQVSAR